MTPNDIANLVAYEHAARIGFGLVALLGVLIVVSMLRIRIDHCPKCDHCRAEDHRKRDEQKRLNEQYAREHGLGDPEDADTAPRQARQRQGDVPGVVVPPGSADQAARPVEVAPEDASGDAPSP